MAELIEIQVASAPLPNGPDVAVVSGFRLGISHRMTRGWLRRNVWPGLVPGLALASLLVALPGLTVWTALSNYHSGTAAWLGSQQSRAFDQARDQLDAEESLARNYRMDPGPRQRAAVLDAGARLEAALTRARQLSGEQDRLRVDRLLALHHDFLLAIGGSLATRDGGSVGRRDPALDAIAREVSLVAARHRADARNALGELVTRQTEILTASPIVALLACALVIVVCAALRASEAQVRDAAEQEAIALRENERRLHSLIQSAKDVILICSSSGAIAYQSPAVETAWGYSPEALTGQSLLNLIHPEDQPRGRAFWSHVLSTPGSTRRIAFRIRWQTGWREVEATLVNLLDEPSIAGVVATISDVNERKDFERQLIQRAFYDPLTGRPNRALFRERIARALMVTQGKRQRAGLLFLDLDNFKLVNDSLGHGAGDRLLSQVAERLRRCVGARDTVARLGGDEFAVILEQLDEDADALPVAEELIQQCRMPFDLEGREVFVTASIGIALSSQTDNAPDGMLREAEVAMYQAKSAGKGQVRLFDPAKRHETMARLDLESDFRRALGRGEFVLYYQPIAEIASASVVEFEALVRWRHPDRGIVAPSEFIPLAEETGLIVPLGRWIMREACRQASAWQRQRPGSSGVAVAVNVSGRQFQSSDLVAEVARVLAETRLEANRLKLEITESSLITDLEAAIAALWRLKDLGVQVVLDDFGTGYSSLAYLRRLPIDGLKIDQSFVRGIGRGFEDAAIVRAMISLAEPLGLSVTAEGIETAEQLDALSRWNCRFGQGFLFGAPVSPSAIVLPRNELSAAPRRASSQGGITHPVCG